MTTVAAAVTQIEEALFAPERLPDALEAAGRTLGFDHFGLVHSEISRLTFVGSEKATASLNAYAAGGWVEGDYRAANVNNVVENQLFLDHLAVDEATRLSSDIYHDLYVPHAMAWFAGWRFSLAGSTWIFSLARAEDKGPVSPGEAAILSALMPHANRTAMLAREMREVRVRGMAEGLATAGVAAVLLDQDGRATFVTPHAEMLFGDDFGIRGGALWASDPRSTIDLALLASIARDDTTMALAPDTVIHRRNRRPLLIQPLPVRGVGLDAFPGARLLLTIVDLDAPGETPVQQLRSLFNLSPAEAVIAVRLAHGVSVTTIAAERNVARETVRVQVKTLSRKLGAHRQSDIVRLVDRLGRNRINHS